MHSTTDGHHQTANTLLPQADAVFDEAIARDTPVDLLDPFFFSSRRRHTRLQGDWSSDVCSSDLLGRAEVERLSRGLVGLLLDRQHLPAELVALRLELGGLEEHAVALHPEEHREDPHL